MATTTNGFAKVHVASANEGVDKAWLESLNDGYNTLRSSFRSQTSWSDLALKQHIFSPAPKKTCNVIRLGDEHA